MVSFSKRPPPFSQAAKTIAEREKEACLKPQTEAQAIADQLPETAPAGKRKRSNAKLDGRRWNAGKRGGPKHRAGEARVPLRTTIDAALKEALLMEASFEAKRNGIGRPSDWLSRLVSEALDDMLVKRGWTQAQDGSYAEPEE